MATTIILRKYTLCQVKLQIKLHKALRFQFIKGKEAEEVAVHQNGDNWKHHSWDGRRHIAELGLERWILSQI